MYFSRLVAAAGLAAVLTLVPSIAYSDTTGEQSGKAIIYETTNDIRAEVNVAPLKVSNGLNKTAQGWADWLAAHPGTFKHNPNVGKQIPSGWQAWGENIAYGCNHGDERKTAQVLIAALKASPGHYKNIVRGGFNNIGIGYTYNSSTRCGYAVQNFGQYSPAFNDAKPVLNDGPFIDVNAAAKRGEVGYHSLSEHILWAYNSGIANGWSVADGKEFRPELSLKRDAMAAFLYRAYGQDDPVDVSGTLAKVKDVDTNHVFAKEIAWMYQYNISTGWPDGTYRPSNDVTRDQLAAFLYRIADDRGDTSVDHVDVSGTLANVKDVDTNHAFAKEIAWMIQYGISTGWSDGTYRPLSDVTRAATMTFVHRYGL